MYRIAIVEIQQKLASLTAAVEGYEARTEQVFSWLARLRTDIAKVNGDDLDLLREEMGMRTAAEVRSALRMRDGARNGGSPMSVGTIGTSPVPTPE